MVNVLWVFILIVIWLKLEDGEIEDDDEPVKAAATNQSELKVEENVEVVDANENERKLPSNSFKRDGNQRPFKRVIKELYFF